MANPEHLEIIKQGVEKWNKWREENVEVSPDLSGWDFLEDIRTLGLPRLDPNLDEPNLSQDMRTEDLRWLDPNLGRPNLSRANLRNVDFQGARLDGMRLRKANLGGASLRHARLVHADLDGADLSEGDLHGADLHAATLEEAQLTRADLGRADCRGADFRGANLSEADLGRADLSLVDFSRANLSEAKLGHANFRRAKLAGANFNKAHIGATTFADVDLSHALGLESLHHDGPSHLSIDTIYRSGGKIPEAFLRGCGVPDGFIAYIGSMVGRPIEFYSCFISYSTKDQEFADRLYADLQAKGVRCWFAPHDIQGGRTIHEQIDEAIRRYDRLLLILSEHSIHSGWVETEIANAWERQIQQGKHVLFPVRLVSFEELEKWKCPDPKTGKDLGREIRKYFIPDFSNWKDHDSYQTAFQRLVKDLKAGTRE